MATAVQQNQIYATNKKKKLIDTINTLSQKNYTPDFIRYALHQEGFDDTEVQTELSFRDQVLHSQNTTQPAQADANGTFPDILKNLDPATAQKVQNLANYKIPFPVGTAAKDPAWQRIIDLAGQYDPSFDANQYGTRTKIRSDFTAGKSAQNIRSLNTAVGHLDTLKQKADALQNAPVKLWNTIKNVGFNETGDKRVTEFNNAATAVENELATVFKGTGATDQEINAWRENLNSSQSPEQLKGAINTAIELMGSRLDALQSQYETGMGKPKDFKFLNDKSQSILKNLGADIGTSDYSVQDNQPTQTAQPNNQVEQAKVWLQANPTDPKAEQVKAKIAEIEGVKTQEVSQPSMLNTSGGEQPIEQKPDGALMGLAKDLGGRVKNIYNNIVEASTEAKGRSFFENLVRSPLTVTEGNLRNVGEVGGAVGDVFGRTLQLAYQISVPEEGKQAIKDKATELLQTEAGQQAISALNSGLGKWEAFKSENPNVAKDIEAAANILTAIPMGKGLGIAGKEGKYLVTDAAEIASRTLGRDVVTKAGDDIFRAVKPTVTVKRAKGSISSALNSANGELIARGFKPTNLQEYADGLAAVKKEIWANVEKAIGSSDGLTVDVKSISNSLMQVAGSPTLLRVDTGAARKIEAMAKSLVSQGERISVPDAEAIKQLLNAELKGTFGKFNLSNAEQNAKKLINQNIGDQLDKLLSDIPGEFQGLKNKYGALSEIQGDVEKRLIVYGRQNPQGLIESFSKISGAGNIIKGLLSGSTADVVKGTGEIVLGKMAKAANDADTLIKNAFDTIAKRSKEFEPRSSLLKKFRNFRPGMTIKDVSKKGEGTIPKIATPLQEGGIKVYHGTGANFDAFNDSMRGSITGAKSAKGAIWFTEDPATAKAYSIYASEDGPIKALQSQMDEAEKIAQRSGSQSDWAKYDKLVVKQEDLASYDKTFARRNNAVVKQANIKNGDFLTVDAKGKSPQELSKEGDIDSWLNSQLDKARSQGKDGVKFVNLNDAVGLSDRPATHYAIFDSKNASIQNTLKHTDITGEGKILSQTQGITPKKNKAELAAIRRLKKKKR